MGGSKNRQEDLLGLAATRAGQGDLKGMLEALTSSGFLLGLNKQIADQYDGVPREELETCVSEVVDEFFSAASGGRRITNPGGWLWKATWYKAWDLWRKHFHGRVPLDDDHVAPSLDDDSYERRTDESRTNRLREEALRQARALLPQIGKGQVVEVLRLLLDAVAQDVPDLPAADVAETLGISEAAARSLMSRALQRLERAARAAGITLPDELASSNQEDDDAAPNP